MNWPPGPRCRKNRKSFHTLTSEHLLATSALLWVLVIVAVLVPAFVPVVLVVVTTLCTDLSADFACWELFRMNIPVCGIGCQCGYDSSEIASSYVLRGGPYH